MKKQQSLLTRIISLITYKKTNRPKTFTLQEMSEGQDAGQPDVLSIQAGNNEDHNGQEQNLGQDANTQAGRNQDGQSRRTYTLNRKQNNNSSQNGQKPEDVPTKETEQERVPGKAKRRMTKNLCLQARCAPTGPMTAIRLNPTWTETRRPLRNYSVFPRIRT